MKIGLLECDHVRPEYLHIGGDYRDMFPALFPNWEFVFYDIVNGHFPNRPVFPGVLILEALAQASAILASHSADADPDDNIIFLFAGIDKARFKRPVEPGDQLMLDVNQTHYKSRVWKYATKATVDGKLAASAEVMFTYRVI